MKGYCLDCESECRAIEEEVITKYEFWGEDCWDREYILYCSCCGSENIDLEVIEQWK